MKRFHWALSLLLAGCSGAGTGTATNASTSNLVSDAASQADATHAAAKVCFSTFETCIKATTDDAGVTACQEALKTCLPQQTNVGPADGTVPDLCNAPAPSDRPQPSDRPDLNVDGGAPRGPRPGDGPGGPLPPPDGPRPSDAPSGVSGDGSSGPRGPRPPLPINPASRIALATCHAELGKCLSEGGDKDACAATAHSCVHDVLKADFDALCSTVATQCASCTDAPACVALTARCAAGLQLPPLPDEGSGQTGTTN